jgi:hypothetical protein
VPLPALGVIDRLEEVIAAVRLEHPARALDEGQVDRVLERRQDDAIGSGALGGEARSGAIGELANRGRHREDAVARLRRTGAALSKARETVIWQAAFRASSSMVASRARQVGPVSELSVLPC